MTKSEYAILSNKKILEYYQEDKIVIEPYNEKQLGTNSYDVTLGEWYFREQPLPSQPKPSQPKGGYIRHISYCDVNDDLYNMYSKDGVKMVWGKAMQAKTYKEYKQDGYELENIKDTEKIIIINPGETILGHTNEFIGGVNSVTTEMKCRSSLGRNFIEVCKCSGLGDCGYINRWTMEITNNSKNYKIALVVGRRLAQIMFIETDGLLNKTYDSRGKYQKGNNLEELMKNWKPDDMLPKMYLDYENN